MVEGWKEALTLSLSSIGIVKQPCRAAVVELHHSRTELHRTELVAPPRQATGGLQISWLWIHDPELRPFELEYWTDY